MPLMYAQFVQNIDTAPLVASVVLHVNVMNCYVQIKLDIIVLAVITRRGILMDPDVVRVEKAVI